MTLHLHPEFIPGCYRCDLSRDEAETLAAEQSACLHPTVTCDDCGAESATPLLRDTIEHHPDGEALNEACSMGVRRCIYVGLSFGLMGIVDNLV